MTELMDFNQPAADWLAGVMAELVERNAELEHPAIRLQFNDFIFDVTWINPIDSEEVPQ